MAGGVADHERLDGRCRLGLLQAWRLWISDCSLESGTVHFNSLVYAESLKGWFLVRNLMEDPGEPLFHPPR